MPELVLSIATGILWYPAKTIKCHEGMGQYFAVPPRVHMDSTQKMAFTGLKSSPVQSTFFFHFSLKLSLKSNDICHSAAFFELSLKIVILYWLWSVLFCDPPDPSETDWNCLDPIGSKQIHSDPFGIHLDLSSSTQNLLRSA